MDGLGVILLALSLPLSIGLVIVLSIIVRNHGGLKGLFKPAWQSENREKALRAIAKINDQAQLVAIATDYRHHLANETRLAATAKLSDQNSLAEVAKRSPNKEVAFCALDSLTVEQLIVDVVMNATRNDIPFYGREFPEKALSKVVGQPALGYIAVNHRYGEVRGLAIERVADQAVLRQIMDNDGDASVRLAAARRLLLLEPRSAPEILDLIFRHVVATGDIKFYVGIEAYVADADIYSRCLSFLLVKPEMKSLYEDGDYMIGWYFDKDAHLDALMKCGASERVISNLLHLITRVQDTSVTLRSESCAGDTYTEKVSFEALRTKARELLGANPPEYCVDYYRDLLK